MTHPVLRLADVRLPQAGGAPEAAERTQQRGGDEVSGGVGHRDPHIGASSAQLGHHLTRLERLYTAANRDQDTPALDSCIAHPGTPACRAVRSASMMALISWAARRASSLT